MFLHFIGNTSKKEVAAVGFTPWCESLAGHDIAILLYDNMDDVFIVFVIIDLIDTKSTGMIQTIERRRSPSVVVVVSSITTNDTADNGYQPID